MNPSLNQIASIINGHVNAKDSESVFTYIEFVKMYGFENDTNTFIGDYKDYVTRWANIKKSSIQISDDDFVMARMVDILKSITLDYSSYEQQDFIAHIDLYNKSHLKALSALYSRKIRQITEFYRKKRNQSVTVIRKNSMKGSKKSIEQIIYEKVFDFVFSNRNIVPSYKNIKRDLVISVENYVDTYSEYFDIPRQKEFTDKTRADMLSANMNDVDFRVYLEIELVISQILFSGDVYLQEIPLVAQVGVDLSQSCVGDMLALKNNLMANTQVNQVDLNEQVALKRKLYEKFLGCDLWYMYVDLQGNITMDVLCKAQNPTGNLLNCGTADTATIENQNLTLLSHIGLFFKPDKTSILKVNAKDYTWSVDMDVIQNDTMYVFPDPNKYGDIGNNKQATYPLIMQYRYDYDIRNLSSGEAANDPIKFITDQGWYSYYSKQDQDFRNTSNTNYQYMFTWLANRGFIANYQQDIWGNHFGILKGFEVVYKKDSQGNIIGVDKIIVEEDYIESEIKSYNSIVTGKGLLLNGGYFEHPFRSGVPFDYNKVLTLNQYYNWSGIKIKNNNLFYPHTVNTINYGTFERNLRYDNRYCYVDNFQNKEIEYQNVQDLDDIITDVILEFSTSNVYDSGEITIERRRSNFKDIHSMSGQFFIKTLADIQKRPERLEDVFYWVDWEDIGNPFNFFISINTLVVETQKCYAFIPYSYDGVEIINTLGVKQLYVIEKNKDKTYSMLYVESDRKVYILEISIMNDETQSYIIPTIYQFSDKDYKMVHMIDLYSLAYKSEYQNSKVDKEKLFKNTIEQKKYIWQNNKYQKFLLYLNEDFIDKDEYYPSIQDFEIPYYIKQNKIQNVAFSYNSSMKVFLLSFVIRDNNGTPYIYEYKFKCDTVDYFLGSLNSSIYTIKSVTDANGQIDDVNYVYNNTLSYPSKISAFPLSNEYKHHSIFTKI